MAKVLDYHWQSFRLALRTTRKPHILLGDPFFLSKLTIIQIFDVLSIGQKSSQEPDFSSFLSPSSFFLFSNSIAIRGPFRLLYHHRSGVNLLWVLLGDTSLATSRFVVLLVALGRCQWLQSRHVTLPVTSGIAGGAADWPHSSMLMPLRSKHPVFRSELGRSPGLASPPWPQPLRPPRWPREAGPPIEWPLMEAPLWGC